MTRLKYLKYEFFDTDGIKDFHKIISNSKKKIGNISYRDFWKKYVKSFFYYASDDYFLFIAIDSKYEYVMNLIIKSAAQGNVFKTEGLLEEEYRTFYDYYKRVRTLYKINDRPLDQ